MAKGFGLFFDTHYISILYVKASGGGIYFKARIALRKRIYSILLFKNIDSLIINSLVICNNHGN